MMIEARRRAHQLLIAVVANLVISSNAWVVPVSRTPLRTLLLQRAQPSNDTAADDDTPQYPPPREIDESLLGDDLTGGRPGAIIETEEQLATKARILQEIEDGTRDYPDWYQRDYGVLTEDEEAEYDIDDPTALDSATLGTWTIQDLRSKFAYEWDPWSGEPDPNTVELNKEGVRYLEENEKDEDGVEVGYDPIFGPSNPMDTR